MKKLNARGFSHDVLLIAVVLVFAIAGVGYLVASHADAPSTQTTSTTASSLGSSKSKCLAPQGAITAPNAGCSAVKEFELQTATNSSALGGIASYNNGADFWFTDGSNTNNSVSSIDSNGVIKEYKLPTPASCLNGVSSDGNNNGWFAETCGNKIGKITPTGAITEYALPTANSGPRQIALGPDGNMWFTESSAGKIGKITPTGAITEYALPSASSSPLGLVTASDGNMWFAEQVGNKIGKITPTGAIREYAVPTANSGPTSVTKDSLGNIWFTENSGGKIAKISTSTLKFTEFTVPTNTGRYTSLNGIVVASDGNIWFTDANNGLIVRVTPKGSFTFYNPISNVGTHPRTIVPGSSGTLWFTQDHDIGELTIGSL
jgi:streptogramin lyase